MPGEPTEEQRSKLERLVGQFDAAERWRKPLEDRWTHFYKQYRSYQAFRDAWGGAKDQPDRDDILGDGKREWGADLFIPWTYWTIETLLPRVVSNRPRGAVLPEDPTADRNVLNMRHTIERQQERITYELVLQNTAKSGLMYGLGGQKSRWEYVVGERRQLMRETQAGGTVDWTPSEPKTIVEVDDPDAVNLDIFEFFWDPLAADVKSARWIMHRVWRDTDYIVKMVTPQGDRPAIWGELPWLTAEDIESSGSPDKYDATRQERLEAQGMTANQRYDQRGSDIHEVWEWHTGAEVYVVVDRRWLVYCGPNPAWHGRKPFHIYRPTFLEGEFAGIGEPEQIEHLQAEMNTMRGQRRDNATLKLMQAYAYDVGRVNPTNIKIGPGMLTGVNGDPSNVLMPLTVGDIPFSSYREEDNLARDIERVTGINDQMQGSQTSGGTATEAQLTVSQANIRIQNKTRRIELEVIRGVVGDWIDLNQQMISQERTIRIPYTPMPGEPPDRRWAWKKMGPDELAGRFSYSVEGGSTAPSNQAEKTQIAQMMLAALPVVGSMVNPQKWVEKIIENMGFQHPEAFMAPDDRMPPEVLDVVGQMLVKAGVPEEQVQQMLTTAAQQGMAIAQQNAQAKNAGQLPPGEDPAAGQQPPQGAEPQRPPEKPGA